MLINGEKEVDSVKGKVNEFSENIETIQDILRRSHGDKELSVKELECRQGSKDGNLRADENLIETKSQFSSFFHID